jgi:hypothetical protein
MLYLIMHITLLDFIFFMWIRKVGILEPQSRLNTTQESWNYIKKNLI